MKDVMGAQVLGGTKWKRFALVMVPTIGIAGAMTVMMAEGVLASSFALSGQAFELSAGSLHGTTFVQTGSVIKDSSTNNHAVAVAGIKSATIVGMCQSVDVPLPFPGNPHLTIKLTAGPDADHPVTASDLVIDMDQVNSPDATFTGVNIGADAADVASKVNIAGLVGAPGGFAQVIDDAQLNNVTQHAYSTTASTMHLNGLGISAGFNGAQCY
jgi:hypothetical protein